MSDQTGDRHWSGMRQPWDRDDPYTLAELLSALDEQALVDWDRDVAGVLDASVLENRMTAWTSRYAPATGGSTIRVYIDFDKADKLSYALAYFPNESSWRIYTTDPKTNNSLYDMIRKQPQ